MEWIIDVNKWQKKKKKKTRKREWWTEVLATLLLMIFPTRRSANMKGNSGNIILDIGYSLRIIGNIRRTSSVLFRICAKWTYIKRVIYRQTNREILPVRFDAFQSRFVVYPKMWAPRYMIFSPCWKKKNGITYRVHYRETGIIFFAKKKKRARCDRQTTYNARGHKMIILLFYATVGVK